MRSCVHYLLPSLLLNLVSGLAVAGTAGREKGRDVSTVYNFHHTLQAGTVYTIETVNLAPGADTVLHVQDAATGAFVDGNDDCGTRLPGCPGLRSWVRIDADPSLRNVWVIVRNYSSTSNVYSATLRITPQGGQPTDEQISFSSGYKREFSTYRDGTHFLTVEEPGGFSDSVMLAISGYAWRGIKLNDDSGVDRMSWIHVPEACTSYCTAVVFPYHFNSGGKVTFIWDEDVHDPACDSDGMSAAMEAALGTDPCLEDTDSDAISDAAEVGGIDVSPPLLKFPLYGAEPLVKDVFLEADWLQCTVPPPTCPDIDYYRLAGDGALDVAARYAPDVKVHIDTGEANSNPATWYTYGAWGGATRHTDNSGGKCSWLEPVRVGYFHAGRLWGFGGGQSQEPGQCFDVGSVADGVAHEMGHNFNLSDGGKQSGLSLTCKPNYVSIMNYAIWGVGFSRNGFGSVPLNPTSVDESYGLGTTDPQKIGHLTNASFQYLVDPNTGAVDWNRDGQIGGVVKAALTWGFNSCDIVRFQQDVQVSPNRHTQAFSRLPVGGDVRLYWFTRRESDGTVEYRYATTFPDNCAYPPPSNCKTNWSPPVSQDATALSGSQGVGAPAATWYNQYGVGHKLLLVYKGTDSKLRYQIYWNGSWSSPAYVPGTSLTVEGDPAAATLFNQAHVYAISSGSLYRWKLDTSGQWTGPTLQQWNDGSTVTAKFGIGLTRGYIPYYYGDTMLIAAIPRVSPQGEIDLAWRNEYDSRWNKISDDRWLHGKAVTQAQPGLAYVTFNRFSDPSAGRFHLAWNPPAGAALMTQSEGNNASPGATSRRLQFRQANIYFTNYWGSVKGNIALLHDISFDQDWQLWGGQTFRENAGEPTEYRDLNFFPYAGGIFNSLIKDQDDYAVIRANLKCCFSGPCPM